MLVRIVAKSLQNRKVRVGVAVLAVLLGCSLASALVTMSLDIGNKAGKELRAYGANILVAPKVAVAQAGVGGLEFGLVTQERYIAEKDLALLEADPQILGSAPYLYGLVEVEGRRAVMVGVKFERVRELSPWWQVTGQWAEEADASGGMVGVSVGRELGLKPGDSLTVRRGYASRRLVVKGTVETGGLEDNQLFVSLLVAQELLERPGLVGAVQVRAMGGQRPLSAVAEGIVERVPGVRARVIAQIAEAEASVLGKIQLLMGLVALLVLVAAGLAVASTMTASVLERTPEIGLMKALGAQNQRIALLFLTEALVIALLGGVLGYALGFLLAQMVGQSVFATTIAPRWPAVPVTFGLAILVALLGSALPVRRATSVDPALTLRGE